MNQALPLLAFTLGLMSSFHCIGMCGPIAMALPSHKGTKMQQLAGLLAYNGGRAITYALIGLMLGSLGSALVWIGYLRYLSVIAGAVMLGYVFWPQQLDTYLHPPLFWHKAVQRVKSQMGQLLKNRNPVSFILLGMLNGLLPCGMVYLALVSSLATGSMVAGATYMFVFGLGTFPAMLTVGFLRQLLTASLRTRIRRLTPIVIALAGAVLMIRGIAIKHPETTSHEITICHGK